MMITQLLTSKIKAYCIEEQSSEVNTFEQNYMINQVLESVNVIIGSDTKTDEELNTIANSLLTKNNLDNCYLAAKSYYDQYIDSLKRDFEKKESNRFLINLLSNLLSSFIYSLLVALIIWLGRDSLGEFLHGFFSKN